MSSIPRIVIAGTNSGCGKTTLSTGIMAALVKRGLRVQPFKVGPDYIDPMFHTFITGRHSRNLDSWMLGEDTVSYLLQKNAADADIAVIEGVMGLYDGFGGNSAEGSTAHVSKIINSPVILVVNGDGMSLSAAALIRGYADFDRSINIKGVIINNINSDGHFQLLKDVIEENTGLTAVGYLPGMDEYRLPDRHLGLVTSAEIEDLKEKINILSGQIEKTIDLDKLVAISKQAGGLRDVEPPVRPETGIKARIGVASDKAFCFYYRDGLDLLEMAGAELVYFSPVKDGRLPEGIDGLYIGGGYPEVWAEELQNNTSMKEDIRRIIQKGLPAYAECGGLMYLSESITNLDGKTFETVGLIPGRSEMTTSLKRFGYIDIEIEKDNIISKAGSRIRGHEFHYSATAVGHTVPTCYKVVKNRRNREPVTWRCGFKVYNLLAGYPHLHFWANPRFAREFVSSCESFRVEQSRT